jgi:hypothetical protein
MSAPALQISIVFDQSPFNVLNKTVVSPHCNGMCWRYADTGGFYDDKILEAFVQCPSGPAYLQAQASGGTAGFASYSAESGVSAYVGQVFHFTSGSYTATITVLAFVP